MITTNCTRKEIQAAIAAGGVVEFAPGLYESAHYRITKPVHLIGNGAVLVGGIHNSLQVFLCGTVGLDGLHDNSSVLAGMGAQQVFQRVNVVVSKGFG